MKSGATIVTASGVLALLCGAFAPAASAQGMDPDAERARQLIHRIRTSMREIDALLLKGGSVERVDQELTAVQKRLEELLDETDAKSSAVLQQIDELIDLSKAQQSQQQQSQDPQGQGGRPPPSGRDDPSKPRDRSDQPEDLAQQPPPGEQPKDGEQPQDGKPDPTEGSQREEGRPPPLGPTGEFERVDLSGRWGMLPQKEAEELQRRSAEEFPQRYRRWMELYFRRVNRLESRD